MRKTIVTCDCCGCKMKSGTLSIAMFPYQELIEFCTVCAPKIEVAVRKAIRDMREEVSGE